MIIVVGGGIFMLTILLLVKFIGDGPIVPIIFLVGWVILALATIKFFSRYDIHQ